MLVTTIKDLFGVSNMADLLGMVADDYRRHLADQGVEILNLVKLDCMVRGTMDELFWTL